MVGWLVLWCRVVVFAVECQREVLGKSGVERCWGSVLWGSECWSKVARVSRTKCWRNAVEHIGKGVGKSGAERCCGSALRRSDEVLGKSGVEKCWGRVV